MAKIFLSKSQFIRGLQCHKSLWLYRNKPELRAEPDAATQAKFDAGHEIGTLAQQLFAGGTLIEFDREKFRERIKDTQTAIAAGVKTIYEATFSYDDVLVMVDILHRGPRGWELYEVKSSTGLKEYHVPDTAVQYYILSGAGLKVVKASVVHLNNEYVRQGDLKVKKLFTISDISEQVQDIQPFIKEQLDKQKKMLSKSVPDIDIGSHCSDPFECDFWDECWKKIPEDSVFDLREKGIDKFKLYREGIVKQKDIPLDILNAKQRFQVESTLKKKNKIDTTKIEDFLKQLWYPLCYLDFETFRAPIPLYDGCWPYQKMPFQYSAFIQEKEGGKLTHHEFLAEPGEDPRMPFVESLVGMVPKGACIMAYNATFEIQRIRELAEFYSKHKAPLNKMIDSFVDLMLPFKLRHVYFWQVKGSYSLKEVLPALVPTMSYEEMEIADGGMAEQAYLDMCATDDMKERTRIRKALLEYCKQDTLGMAEIVKKLHILGSKK